MTRRLFRPVPNFNIMKMASTRPHESPRVSRGSRGRVAIVYVPHRSRLEDVG